MISYPSLKAIHQRFKFGARREMILLIGLLIVAWLVLSEVGEARSSIGQDNRLTPIQREIERQRQRLGSAEVEERRDALMRLGNLKRPEASRAAAAALHDAEPVVRVTAAHAIVSLPSREAVSLLTPLLKDKSEFVRREAAYVLGETRDRSAVSGLIDLLQKDKQASVRSAAAVALGQISDETAVQVLSQVLIGMDPTKKKKSKSREDEFVLRSAARSLGQIRSRTGVPALIAALEDSTNSSDTRREAATALGVLGDSSALPALQAAYSSSDDPYLAEAVRAAIRSINRTKN
jgi:HEAT repeat protein